MEEKDTTSFITKWETTAPEEPIYIGANSDYDYDFTIDWGDGTVECIDQAPDTNMFEHTYSAPGTYRVVIQGRFPAFNMNPVFEFSDVEPKKLVGMEQWGNIVWQDLSYAFIWCTKMLYTATDAPDLTNVTSLEKTFHGAWLIRGDLSGWDTSTITNMAYMFSYASTFNGEIGGWDTSNVTNMTGMFLRAGAFNKDISGWDTSSVTRMAYMFYGAISFNGKIGGWDTSSVAGMDFMFSSASSFDQNLGSWDISSIDPIRADGMMHMLDDCGMSALNFSNTLIGWASQKVQPKVKLGAQGLHLCLNDNDGIAAYSTLKKSPNNWTIKGADKKACD